MIRSASQRANFLFCWETSTASPPPGGAGVSEAMTALLSVIVFSLLSAARAAVTIQLGDSPLPEWLFHCDPRNYVRSILTPDFHHRDMIFQPDRDCLHKEARAVFHLCAERMNSVRALAVQQAEKSECRTPRALEALDDEEAEFIGEGPGRSRAAPAAGKNEEPTSDSTTTTRASSCQMRTFFTSTATTGGSSYAFGLQAEDQINPTRSSGKNNQLSTSRTELAINTEFFRRQQALATRRASPGGAAAPRGRNSFYDSSSGKKNETSCFFSVYDFHRDFLLHGGTSHFVEKNLFRLSVEPDIEKHLPYMPTLWRDTFSEVSGKLMLLHDIRWDVMHFFTRTKLDKWTNEEVHLPFRRGDREVLVQNLFRLPPDWSLHPRTRRWHVVCALCRKVATENPDLEVLRIAEIGVFAGETTLHMLENCTNADGMIEPFPEGRVSPPEDSSGGLNQEYDLPLGSQYELEKTTGSFSSSRSSTKGRQKGAAAASEGAGENGVDEEEDKSAPLRDFFAKQRKDLERDNSMLGRTVRSNSKAATRKLRTKPVKIQYNLIDPWELPAAGFQIMVDWYKEHESWKINDGNDGNDVYKNLLRRIKEVERQKNNQPFPITEMRLDEVVPSHQPGIFTHKRTSDLAARSVTEIDFLFVDGDHSYQGCHDDMRFFYPKTKILAAGHDFRYWDFHGIVLAVLNMRRPGTPAHADYGHRCEGPVYLDSENIHWSYIKQE
ncbi:unnamed protein product [Amoebophrya sp. A120]|nr:unnamed protein product [Amoebophrya sp. A120]|eukprot:GSA120T00002707001.1